MQFSLNTLIVLARKLNVFYNKKSAWQSIKSKVRFCITKKRTAANDKKKQKVFWTDLSQGLFC
jgi:hypothetical protein